MPAKYGVNKAELRHMLSASTIEADMRAYAEQVAERARSSAPQVGDVDGGPREIDLPITVTSSSGSFAARASVTLAHPAGINVEAKHALLARSQ